MNVHARVAARSTLTSKGQTTVPKEIRDALGIAEGARIDWVLEDGRIAVTATPPGKTISELAGILGKPPAGRAMTVREMDDALGEALREDDERIRAGR